ncbi:MAG: glycosyltransferase family 2 protein [Kofleriaceae bacterium]|jgi:glycosyltransferase involved in cell wall biosynthesis|nr:glycosyltransferase family 2 protein [Kofleriaceae bacterium]MBP6840794.1 glycosyltransferase family 2 protein [Kofleriaceae bacterium]MBP9206576.1 glycosyltransferase family 2 protein [Kofleriaceae bacterium]
MTLTCDRVTHLPQATTFSGPVAIAIAAYNEAPHLRELVRRCVATGPARIVIVDDCSTDDSAAVLAALRAEVGPVLVVLRNEHNLGKQGSVRRALRHLRREAVDAVALIDGDLQHEPAELPPLAELLRDVDLVIGARATTEMPVQRRLSNWLVNGAFRLLAGIDFGDVQSGLRVMRKDLADALGAALPERGGFGVEHESLAILATLSRRRHGGVRAVAAPITCRYGDEVSHIGVRDIGRLALATVRQAARLRHTLRAPVLLPAARPAALTRSLA